MQIAIVKGMVVSTQKDQRLIGSKLLIIQRTNADGEVIGKDEVAVDSLGAGVGELVLLCSGSSARAMLNNPQIPVDLAVVGIIDTMENNL